MYPIWLSSIGIISFQNIWDFTKEHHAHKTLHKKTSSINMMFLKHAMKVLHSVDQVVENGWKSSNVSIWIPLGIT
jgi:hypothetical protein